MIAQRKNRHVPRHTRLQKVSHFVKNIERRFGLYTTRDPYSLVYEEHLRRLLSSLAINCVLDVGSHHGEFAKLLRKVGYRGLILSFEPVADNFGILDECRHGDPNWRIYRMALGAAKGAADIKVFSGTTFHSFLSPSKFGQRRFPEKLRVERTEAVEVERLDNILDGLIEGIANPQIFLKADTQGYDIDVVRGLGTSVTRINALQIEITISPLYENVTNSLADSIGYLQGLGFQLSGMFPVVFDPANENCLIELDCVMCRSRSPGNGAG